MSLFQGEADQLAAFRHAGAAHRVQRTVPGPIDDGVLRSGLTLHADLLVDHQAGLGLFAGSYPATRRVFAFGHQDQITLGRGVDGLLDGVRGANPIRVGRCGASPQGDVTCGRREVAEDGDDIVVSAVNPEMLMGFVQNPEMDAVADHIGTKLQRMIAALGA